MYIRLTQNKKSGANFLTVLSDKDVESGIACFEISDQSFEGYSRTEGVVKKEVRDDEMYYVMEMRDSDIEVMEVNKSDVGSLEDII